MTINQRETIKKRVEEEWTEKQLDIWEDITSKYKRVEIDGKKYIISLLYSTNYIFDGDKLRLPFIKSFYSHFIDNIRNMLEFYEYRYVRSTDENIKDFKGRVSFDIFSFTLESMKDDIAKNGMYLPLLGYGKKEEGNILLSGGRHRIVALRELHKEGILIDKEHLCILLDSHKENIQCSMIVPTLLLDTFFCDHKREEYNEHFSKIIVDNPVDLWIIFKLQEKELDLIIEKYSDIMNEYGIIPSDLITRGITCE